MIDHFVMYGEPRGKERPRVANGHAYTPQKTREYEEALRWAWQFGKRVHFDGNVQMKVIAFYKIPKAANKDIRARMLNGDVSPTRKPDVDNIMKIVADALNGLAYDDDKQLNAVSIEKRYSLDPRVSVFLTDEGLGAIDAY